MPEVITAPSKFQLKIAPIEAVPLKIKIALPPSQTILSIVKDAVGAGVTLNDSLTAGDVHPLAATDKKIVLGPLLLYTIWYGPALVPLITVASPKFQL